MADPADESAQDDPLIGQTLGEFEIVELIGRGGMGAVYKASQPSLGRFVAIKVLPAELSRNERFLARFEREARTAAAVEHPNIVEIFTVGEDRGYHFIAMELVHGHSLSEIVRRRGPLPADRAVEVVRQTATALAKAHAAGILHRDIKPSNILLTEEGEVKVADFGLAKRPGLDADVTHVGGAVGTPNYLAPECIRGGHFDARSDLYALGATFYHILSGRPPFAARTSAEVIAKVLESQPPRLREVAPGAPRGLARLIGRLLSKDPANRCRTAEEFLDALAAAETAPSGSLGDLIDALAQAPPPAAGETPSPAPVVPPTPRSPESIPLASKAEFPTRLVLAVGGAVALAAAVVLAIVLWPRETKPPAEDTGGSTVARRERTPTPPVEPQPKPKRPDKPEPKPPDKPKPKPPDRPKPKPPAPKPPAKPGVLDDDAQWTQWEDLFDGKTLTGWRVLDAGVFRSHGTVAVDRGRIVLKGEGTTGICWTGEFPRIDYQVELDIMAAEFLAKGSYGATVGSALFPVGAQRCVFVMGGVREYVALSNVDGKAGANNETTRPTKLEPGQWYHVRLSVTQTRITVWLNRQQVIDLPVAGHTFTARMAGYEKVETLGLKSRQATTFFRNIRLRRLRPRPWKVYTKWPFDAREARRRQEETAQALGVPVEQDINLGNGVKIPLVLIPAGEFLMGSPPTTSPEQLQKFFGGIRKVKDYRREFPQHRVRISKPFWLGKTEVTQAQWQAVMGDNPSHFKGKPQAPVERVTWNDCRGFLRKLSAKTGKGLRLPTEAQWEYACRAGSAADYCFGPFDKDRLAQYAWLIVIPAQSTSPVGQKRPNAWGLYDMHGNVWEWCEDWFAPYDEAPQVDPSGARAGQAKVLRGGSWHAGRASCRSAYRNIGIQKWSGRIYDHGLRVCAVAAAPRTPTTQPTSTPPARGPSPAQREGEGKFQAAVKPAEAKVKAWDFAAAAAELAKLKFADKALAERLAVRRDEVKRLAALKAKLIERVNKAKPWLRKATAVVPGSGGKRFKTTGEQIVKADDAGLRIRIVSKTAETTKPRKWADLDEASVQKLLSLDPDRDSAEAEGDFEMLFGAEAKKVSATPGTGDDAKFAAKLLESAKSLGDAPKLQTLVYRKAYEFALKDPPAHDKAMEALELWAKAAPGEVGDLEAKKLELARRRFQSLRGAARKEAAAVYLDLLLAAADTKAAAGDAEAADPLYVEALRIASYVRSARRNEIVAKRHALAEQLAAARRLAAKRKALEGRLRAEPTDVKARTSLVILYLLEDDDPQAAAKLVTPDLDEALRTYVPLAAKPVDGLAEAVCLELGAWFERIGAEASAKGKAAALTRAAAYYRRYLELHAKNDAPALKAKLSLAAIRERLAKLRGNTGANERGPKTVTLTLAKGVTMKLVRIPAGSFLMGSTKSDLDRRPDEGPQHKVTITRPFYMGVTEVTQEQYVALMGKNPSKVKGANNPVEFLTWHEAVAFCKKLSAMTRRIVRLPTEAEWEYACRAGTKTRFSFGDDVSKLADYAWFKDNSGGKSHPVGEKKPNPWGLCDMHGNVKEWCVDWYDEKYYSASASCVDPAGPASGDSRVLRGGSWCYPGESCRSAFRSSLAPDNRFYTHGRGFRVVIPLRSRVD